MSTVAVIGGAGGIGRVLVAALLRDGHDVVVLDLPASLERHKLDCATIPLDVLDDQSITDAVDSLHAHDTPLTGLVNLVGFTSGVATLADIAMEGFDETIAGNLRGTFASTRALLPLVAEGGSVVTVASGLAQHIRPGHGAYAMAKAGIIAMTKTMAVENAPSLRVNAVAPGPVRTAFLTGGTGRSGENEQSIIDAEKLASATPLARIAEPEDVTGPIRFLLGEQSRFMTGQVLWINGGAYMP